MANIFDDKFIDQTSDAYLSLTGQRPGLYYPPQYVTAQRPLYVRGGMYFDLTTNKLVIGGATAFETVTSV